MVRCIIAHYKYVRNGLSIDALNKVLPFFMVDVFSTFNHRLSHQLADLNKTNL